MTADRDLGIQLTELKREATIESRVISIQFPKVPYCATLRKSVNSKEAAMMNVVGYHFTSGEICLR